MKKAAPRHGKFMQFLALGQTKELSEKVRYLIPPFEARDEKKN